MDDLTQLALAAQRGDVVALEDLIRRTQPDVWRLCAHLGGRQRADDLTQETFLRAWRSLPSYRAESSVRTWLLAVARHTVLDAARAATRRPTTVSLGDDAYGERWVGQPGSDPASIVTTERLLAGLAPERRLALFLTQLIGLSYAEAAAVCEVPVGTIRSRVARGRQDLAGDLDAAVTP